VSGLGIHDVRREESWRRAGFTCVTAPSVRLGVDPDLAGVRTAAPTAFAKLTSVKFDWAIDWGLFSDYICLTNKFPFPLTGVTFDARVTSTGNAEWRRRFTTERIGPGETFCWNTRLTSRGQDAKGTGQLYTDQDPLWGHSAQAFQSLDQPDDRQRVPVPVVE
jgi:hypothetical protein